MYKDGFYTGLSLFLNIRKISHAATPFFFCSLESETLMCLGFQRNKFKQMKGLFKMIIFTKILFSLSLSLFIVYSTNKRIESSAFGSVFSFSCTLTFSFTCFFSFIIFFCFIVQGLKIVCA